MEKTKNNIKPDEKAKELDKKLAIVEKDSQKFLSIQNQKQYAGANEFLSVVKKKGKEFDDERKTITEPMNAALDATNAIYQPRIKKCKEIENIVKNSMSAFLREEDRIAKAEENRLADLRDKQNERREEKGQAPILTPLPTIERQDTTIATKTGASTAKKEWKYKIISVKDIPQKYLQATLKLAIEQGLLDRVLREAVKSGEREIKGIEIYEDFAISTKVNKGFF